MTDPARISEELVADTNGRSLATLTADYEHLGEVLARRGLAIDELTEKARAFAVALPSWGVGTGGTRFARFPGPGEPRNVFEKLEDCATVHQLVRCTPTISLHIPWDRPDDASELRERARSCGLSFDAMNSNTFQDQPDQELSYRYGSLTHVDKRVRRQAIDHNIECVEIGRELGSKALTVWIADGGNFPGQLDFRGALARYVEATARREPAADAFDAAELRELEAAARRVVVELPDWALGDGREGAPALLDRLGRLLKRPGPWLLTQTGSPSADPAEPQP